MIRMGKSSKARVENENSDETVEEFTPAVSLKNDVEKPQAFSDSELMARDIKEGRLSGFVGNGTVLTGETTFDSMLRVDGHLKGQVTSNNGTLVIGSTGQVDAGISVSTALVNGAVNGDIVATEKLTLGRSARVVGDIMAPRLVIEDGAILEGKCSMVESLEALKTEQVVEVEETVAIYEQANIEDDEVTSDITLVEDDYDDEEANAATY